jgi:hypothetical protein
MAGSAVIGALRVILGLDSADFESGVKRATQKTNEIDSAMSKVGKVIAGAFTVGAVVNFGEKIFDAASRIHDMSAAVGFSAEAFQRNKFAVEQSGGSVETFSRAAQKLNAALGDGNKSTVAALKAAGLEFESIRNMKPEQAWTAVTNAVGKIEDPLTRAHVAQELFGKGAVELLPGMIEGYEKIGKAATVMSDDTVDRLEAAQDAWDKFGDKVTIVSGEALGGLMKATEAAASGFTKLWGDVKATATGGIEGHRQYLESLKALAEQETKTAEASTEARKQQGPSIEELIEQQKREAEAAKKAQAAQEAHTKAVMAYVNAWNGSDLSAKAKLLAEAYAKLTPAQKTNSDVMERVAKDAAELESKGITLGGVLHDLAMHHAGVAAAASLNEKVTRGLINTTGMYTVTAEHLNKQTDAAIHSFAQFVDVNTDLATALGQTGYLIGGLPDPPVEGWARWADAGKQAMDMVSAGFARSIAAMLTGAASLKDGFIGIWHAIADAFSSVLEDMLSGFIKGFLGDVMSNLGKAAANIASSLMDFGKTAVSGLGSLLSGGIGSLFIVGLPLVIAGMKKLGEVIWSGLKKFGSWIGGLFHGEGEKTNDVRDQWMQAMGGFEGSRQVLAGHGNDAQLIAAFDKAYYAGDRGGFEAGRSAFEQRLMELDMGSMGADVPGFATGTGGKYLDFGAGTLAMLHGPEMITPKGVDMPDLGAVSMRPLILQVDGRAFGRVMFNPLAREAARMQVTQG